MINSALMYLKHGYSVIPVRPDKKPCLDWAKYQKKRMTEDEARACWARWPNAQIAIITGSISGIVVIDIDDPSIHEIDKLVEGSHPPSALTPSGGQHLFFKSPVPPLPNNSRVVPGCDFRGEGGYVLVAPSEGYCWIEGDLTTLNANLSANPPELPQKYIDYVRNNKDTKVVTMSTLTIPEGTRDEALFHLANRLFRGGASEQEVEAHLRIFANQCKPPFPEKEMEAKIKSALKRDMARSGSLAQTIKEWVGYTRGYFSVTDLDRELSLVTSSDKNNRKQIIYRLVEDGILERFPNKNGIFRRVISEYNEIDLSLLDPGIIQVVYPFQIEKLVDTMPKNIIIVAGEPDSGKTSFLLNFAHMNMGHHQIRYLTSEMSRPELKSRLSRFSTKPKDWRVQFIERAANFADLILPDAITLIDYLEISDNFFLVAGMIKEIFDRLTSGIAMIALQKNRGTDVGLGGYRSLEKARLYLAMSYGKIKIVKGKNWHCDVNPNGLIQNFNLYQGADFIRLGDWHKEEEKIQ